MIALPPVSGADGTANGAAPYAAGVQRLVDEYQAASPEVRRAWLKAEIQAAKTCDRGALQRLAQRVGE